MLSQWRRPRAIGCPRASLLRLPFATTRSLQPTVARSWNRLIILFYSSIISTAAAADANAKQKRRKQWDVVIAEAERSLQIAVDPTSSLKASVFGNENFHNEVTHGRKFEAPNNENIEMGQIVENHTKQMASTASSTASFKTVPRGAGIINISAFESLDKPSILNSRLYERARGSRASIYTSEERRWRRAVRWTPKKHVGVEFSAARLAIGFLIEAEKDDSLNGTRHFQQLLKTMSDVSGRFRHLKKMDAFDLQNVTRLQYPQYHSNMDYRHPGENPLNSQIARSIEFYSFKKTTTYAMTLRRIAYLLFQSESPPNVATYTLLIDRFSRLGHYDLANMVISAMSKCHIRPDELSVMAMLHHYKIARAQYSFHDLVLKIQGYRGGLMLARPDITQSGVGSSRLIPCSNNKVVQAMTLNSGMVTLIIRGYLSFGLLKQALFWVRKMHELGMKSTPRLLADFIRYYAASGQWEAGLSVWKEIQKHYSLPRSSEMKNILDDAIVFHSMLKLCKSCGKMQELSNVFKEAMFHGLSAHQILEFPQQGARSFSFAENRRYARRRTIGILHERVAMLIEDNQTWALHVLASKMVLSKHSTLDLRAMFHRFGRMGCFPDWLRSRPKPQQTPLQAQKDVN